MAEFVKVTAPAHDNSHDKVYVVPVWATNIARDENGKLWAFEKEPVQSPESADYNLGFWHLSANGGNCIMIEEPVKGRNSVCPHWRDTLQEVHP